MYSGMSVSPAEKWHLVSGGDSSPVKSTQLESGQSAGFGGGAEPPPLQRPSGRSGAEPQAHSFCQKQDNKILLPGKPHQASSTCKIGSRDSPDAHSGSCPSNSTPA